MTFYISKSQTRLPKWTFNFLKRNYSQNCSKQAKIEVNDRKEFNLNKLGFIGTGKIAQAIIIGLIKQKKISPKQIYVSDTNLDCLSHLRERNPLFKKYEINFLKNNKEVLDETNTVMLCVKPKDIVKLLKETSDHFHKNHLIISIAAGIQLNQIQKYLIKEARVIRLMMNINCLVQKSCSVFSRGINATDADAEYVQNLLETIGTCDGEIEENLMDVFTALSGSGPAYMFLILDALADGAVKMGMSRQLALRLAAHTMLGSASLAIETSNCFSNGKHIMQLKEEVCSPGGTSIHGIAELENYRVRSALIRCIETATIRSKELNNQE